MREATGISVVYFLIAAGCVIQPAGEVVSAGMQARLFRDTEILKSEGTSEMSGDFPQSGNVNMESDDGSLYYYFDHDFQYDAAMQDEDYKPFNEMGRLYGEGFSTRLSVRMAWRAQKWLYFGVVPEWYFGESLNNGEPDRETVFHEALIRLSLGNTWVEWGRFPMWWGPGTHGGLLLTNNYRTRNTIRVSTAEPIVMRGWLSSLGLARVTMFASDLTEGEPDTGRYLGGARLSFKPSPAWEMGLSRTFVLPKTGGDADADMFFDALLYRTDESGTDPADQKAAIDFRYTFGANFRTTLYAELATENEAGAPAATALLAGAASYLPLRNGHLRITAEWADTNVDGHGTSWYAPEYFYRNNCIGHHAGTDGTDFYAETTLLNENGNERIRLYIDREAHGVSAPVTEVVFERGLTVSIDEAAPWIMEFRAAHQETENAGGVAGVEETATLISFAVKREL